MERRVEDLEVKMAFLEKQVQDLDEVVRSLGDTVDLLRREVKELRESGGESEVHKGSLEDEVPPHY